MVRCESFPAHLSTVPLELILNRRSGILVVINDADWELEGGESYEIQPGDNILFMSTLHGG